MPRQRQGEFFPVDPTSVVTNTDELTASVDDIDVDIGRPGVEAVLDQLLDHRGRALDDLAGGDLIDEVVRELSYRHCSDGSETRHVFRSTGKCPEGIGQVPE